MRTASDSKDGLVWFRLFAHELDFALAIGFSPMADSDYIDNPFPIVDAENNSVVANSDTPQVLFALQFTRPGRPWFLGKSFDPRYHSPYDGTVECLQLPARRTRKRDRIVSHRNSAYPAGAISA